MREKAQSAPVSTVGGRTKGCLCSLQMRRISSSRLFEDRSAHYARTMVERMKTAKTKSENLQSLREFYSCRAGDKHRALLTMEFKLFAIRHPDSKRRLRQAYRLTHPAASKNIPSICHARQRSTRSFGCFYALIPSLSGWSWRASLNLISSPTSGSPHASANLDSLDRGRKNRNCVHAIGHPAAAFEGRPPSHRRFPHSAGGLQSQ